MGELSRLGLWCISMLSGDTFVLNPTIHHPSRIQFSHQPKKVQKLGQMKARHGVWVWCGVGTRPEMVLKIQAFHRMDIEDVPLPYPRKKSKIEQKGSRVYFLAWKWAVLSGFIEILYTECYPAIRVPTQQKIIWPLRGLGPIMFKTSSFSDAFSQGLHRTSKILRIEDSPWSTKPRRFFSTKPWKFCFLGGWCGVQLCTSLLCKFPHATDGMWVNSAWKWSFQQQLSSANFTCGGCKRNFP